MDEDQGVPHADVLEDNEAQWNPPGFFLPPPVQQQNAEEHHPEYDVESHDGPPSSGWSEVETAGGVPPSARSLHSAALLNDSLLVFGGFTGTERSNSFHAYSFLDRRWSPILPSANSGPPPSPRDRHVSVAHENTFYVHGGFDGQSRDNRLFAFDFSSMTWREIVANQGRAPSARHSHSAIVYNNSMYVFGGYDGSYKSDLHCFDFGQNRWSAVPASGRRPRARYRGSLVVYRHWMILYGGHDGTRHLSDAFIFDFHGQAWHSIQTEGPSPLPRDSHVACVHGQSMFIFGGSSGSAMNDLHELHLPASTNDIGKWRPVNTGSPGQPRPRFCHCAVAYADSLFVFGGYDSQERLQSFIRFDFSIHDLNFDVPPSTLLGDLRGLVNNDRLSDVCFMVDGKLIYGHKFMLMRCSYFEALFLGRMREATLDTVQIEQVRYEIFLLVLEYLYTDQLVIHFNDAMEVFQAADLFCIPRLKTMCEKRMLHSITVENAAEIFHAADLHSAMALRAKVKKYILSHFEEVSRSITFEEMGRNNIDLVFEILRSR